MQNKRHYIKNCKELIAFAEAKDFDGRELRCQDCRYFKNSMISPKCTNPIVVIARMNSNYSWIQECKEQRRDYSSWGKICCGPNAILFRDRKKYLVYHVAKKVADILFR